MLAPLAAWSALPLAGLGGAFNLVVALALVGAVNLPVLDNDERAIVGTTYVQESRFLARRIGAASKIVKALTKHASVEGYQTMTLVAVNKSVPFWERHGFMVAEVPELYGKLLSYEESARYMVKHLV